MNPLILPTDVAGQRLDAALAALLPAFSRSCLSAAIKAGQIQLNNHPARPRDTVYGGEMVSLDIQPPAAIEAKAQPIALTVLHEDEHVLVINKPAGLVVHPGAGNPDGTLLNALLHHNAALAQLPRAGLVHRLDKDTSGVMVVAQTQRAQRALTEQLESRQMKRHYIAVVTGALITGGTVNAPIARHPRDRLKMAVYEEGREAITHYRLRERFHAHTALNCHLETGRTHQIRVHMAYCKHPIVGDPLYGGPLKLPRAASASLVTALRGFKRQALHAHTLEFIHPATNAPLCCHAELPDDLTALLTALRADTEMRQA